MATLPSSRSNLHQETRLDEAINAIQEFHHNKQTQKHNKMVEYTEPSFSQLQQIRSSTRNKLSRLPLQRRQSLRQSLAQIVMLENVDRMQAERVKASPPSPPPRSSDREGKVSTSRFSEDLETQQSPPELDEDDSDSSRSDEESEAWWDADDEVAIEEDAHIRSNELYRFDRRHSGREQGFDAGKAEVEFICGRLDELNDLLGENDAGQVKCEMYDSPTVDVVEITDQD